MNAKPRVAVMGAGAVGSYFGGMLARAGVPVVLIGRPAHVEAIRRDKLFMDTLTFQERVAVETSVRSRCRGRRGRCPFLREGAGQRKIVAGDCAASGARRDRGELAKRRGQYRNHPRGIGN